MKKEIDLTRERENARWHLVFNVVITADMVVLQEAVLKSLEKDVAWAVSVCTPREDGEIWPIELRVETERARLINYWSKLGTAVNNYNHQY